MTRRDYIAIAWAIRQAHPHPMPSGTAGDLASDFYAGRERQWLHDALAIENVLAESNGRFDHDRFGIASGRILRPDGSMWPMSAPR